MDQADDTLGALRHAAAQHAQLRLLLLHGSRARGDHRPASDWDLGYLADDGLDSASLHADIARVLRTDDVDLTDLSRASALLRFSAARDGRCVYASTVDAHQDFVLAATIFWCDAEAVIRRAHAAVLFELRV